MSDAMNPHASRVPDRVYRLEGSHNVRDLGGLTTGDGRLVRRGLVFRSDYPGFAEVNDGAAVRRLGLRTVVDLRRGTEASFECVSWDDHGVKYHRTPLSAGGETSWHARYHAYLTSRPETVVEAVRHVTSVDTQPVLFHCAAGKDRTGVVAALVLSVLGVEARHIVADYVLTEAALKQIMARLTVTGPYVEMLAGASLEDQRPRAQHMESLLEWLDTEHGGARAWLEANGLSPAHLDAFREHLLSD
jgi:protein-tyrosine phosphatase